jgi:endonuclease G
MMGTTATGADGTHRSTHAEASKGRTVYAPAANDDSSSMSMSPTLPIRVIRPNPNLEIAFDVRTRNPIYVLEKLQMELRNKSGQTTATKTVEKRRRRPPFYEERGIEQETYRSRQSHYRNSGYDRGHLAPAADFSHDEQEEIDTFNLCNVSPQDHIMNLSIWNRLEEWIRRVAAAASANKGCDTYVVTGPLWLPTKQVDDTRFEYSYVGLGRPPSLVSVPTHFFKVVVVVLENEIVQFACFVVENGPPDKTKELQDYIVPWTDLETVTGLQFFPNWATLEWKAWADQLTHDSVFGGSQQQRLLLTNGSSNNKGRKKLKKGSISQSLQHLCKEGQCSR